MGTLPDDIDLEAGLLAGRQRIAECGHDHDADSLTVRLQCPFCPAEITAILGCAACIPRAASSYAAHQIIIHRELLAHAYDRFSAGVGRKL